VIDALSNYLGYLEHSFRILGDFDPSLKPPQIKNLKRWYRNLPAHQAIIMPRQHSQQNPPVLRSASDLTESRHTFE
jgi:hypothetical protein